jgi:hypothetical protein
MPFSNSHRRSFTWARLIPRSGGTSFAQEHQPIQQTTLQVGRMFDTPERQRATDRRPLARQHLPEAPVLGGWEATMECVNRCRVFRGHPPRSRGGKRYNLEGEHWMMDGNSTNQAGNIHRRTTTRNPSFSIPPRSFGEASQIPQQGSELYESDVCRLSELRLHSFGEGSTRQRRARYFLQIDFLVDPLPFQRGRWLHPGVRRCPESFFPFAGPRISALPFLRFL